MTTLDHELLTPASASTGEQTRGRWLERRPLLAFFVGAYAFSWLLWLLPALGLRGPLGALLVYAGVFGPAVTAAVVTRRGGGSVRAWLREFVRFRAGARSYAVIIGFPIALALVTNGLFTLTGGDLDVTVWDERLAVYIPALIIWTIAAVGEEPGWRGFALPRLQERLSPVRATLVLGVLWALWHLPLLAAADEPSHRLDALPLVGVTALTVLAIVGYAFFYTFLWNRTRNIWLAILFHGSISGAIAGFILLPSADTVGGTYAHLQLATTVVVGVAALALVRATRGRLGLADEQSTKPQRTSGDFRRSLLTHGLLALIALVAAAALAGSAGAAAPQLGAASPAEIDRFIEKEIDARRVPGYAVAVVRGTELVHVRGFGAADRAGRAVTADTPFVLGSTTKSFTALAVMQLVDAGKISLEAPIARYIPELRLAERAERRITVRQLLNQTSGIPGLAGGRLLRSVGDGTLEDVVNELNGTKVVAAPGTRFEYANANFVLLGLVIERTSGLSYGDYVEQRIFAPLSMQHSFANPAAAHAAGLAVGHRYWFGFAVAHGPTSPDSVRPAGYLMSSARDMGRYLAMYLNGGELDGRRLVSAEGLRTLLAPVASTELGPWADSAESRYAMGWFVGGPWSEPALLHPGRDPDSSAMIVLLPQKGLGVATLSNASLELPLPGGASSLQRTARGVVSLLVGEEPDPGISFARFYVIFDAVVVLTLAALVWSLVRVLRRRHRDVHGWRLTARSLRAVAEVGAGTLLLALPVIIGQGWAAAMLWWPDLALAVLVIGGLLIATGSTRAVALVVASRRCVKAGLANRAARSRKPRTTAAERRA